MIHHLIFGIGHIFSPKTRKSWNWGNKPSRRQPGHSWQGSFVSGITSPWNSRTSLNNFQDPGKYGFQGFVCFGVKTHIWPHIEIQTICELDCLLLVFLWMESSSPCLRSEQCQQSTREQRPFQPAVKQKSIPW